MKLSQTSSFRPIDLLVGRPPWSPGSWSGVVFALATLHCGGEDVTTLDEDPTHMTSIGSVPPAVRPTRSPSTPGKSARPEQPDVTVGGSGKRPMVPAVEGNATELPVSPIPLRRCEPRSSGGPFWLTEGDSVVIHLECGDPSGSPELIEVLHLPPGATYDVSAQRISFTPGLDQAGVYDLVIAGEGPEDVGHVEVQVADRFDDPNNVPVDPNTYTMEYGLPVVHLGLDAGVNRDEYTPASIVFRGHHFEGSEAKYRGRTSFGYPKRSYTLKFAKTDRFSDPQSVAGFVGKRKVTLTTTFDDNSNLRARLAFQLWNQLSAEHIQVGTYSVVAYVDGNYQGLYTLTDHVDRHLMEDNGLFEDGNLFKARAHDANFRLAVNGVLKTALRAGYEKVEGTPAHGEEGAYADLEELVHWVATSSSESFVAELNTRLVQRDYEDWWLLIGFLGANDSAGKNSYHYRDPRPGAPDGRFRYIPWDFNDSFGQSWRSVRRPPESNPPSYFVRHNELFERLLTEPELREPLLNRFHSVLDQEWSLPSMLGSLDTWASEIRQAALRDERLWGAAYAEYFYERTDILTHEQEVAYLRQWIVDRHAFVRDVFLAAPPDVASQPPPPLDLQPDEEVSGSDD